MNLFTAVLFAWLGAAPEPDLCEQPAKAHYCPLAASIVAAAEERPLWAREDGAKATALLLATIAKHESGLKVEVLTCQRGWSGDGGRSVSAFQLMRGVSWFGAKREELCDIKQEVAAKTALRVLHLHRDRWKSWTPDYLLRAYAAGDGGVHSRAAWNMFGAWLGAMKKTGTDPKGFLKGNE